MQNSDPVVLKGAAGVFGILTACWTLLSLFAAGDLLGELRPGVLPLGGTVTDAAILGIHAVFAVCAWHFHRRGKPGQSGQAAEEPPVEEGVWPPPPRGPQ